MALRSALPPYNGYRAGITSAPYYDVCPAELAARFLAQYQAGHELYVHEQRVRDADAQLNFKRAEIARLEDAAARSGLRAIKESSTVEQRVQSVLDARQYAERIGRLKSDVAQFERDRMLYAQELAAYRATVASTH